MTWNILNAKITSSLSEIHSVQKSIESPKISCGDFFLSFMAISKILICRVLKMKYE